MVARYFDAERAFERIWQDADTDGLWQGDAATLAQDFGVSEDAAYSVIRELCDRRLIELVGERCYAIVNWREREELAGGAL
jgi:hypothetical protein